MSAANPMPVALTIAGSDPSGGAGIQGDLKTFHQHRVYGAAVITLLTVQNTVTVRSARPLEAEFVLEQVDAVLEDLPPQAAKTGALGTAAIVEGIAARAVDFGFPLVIDPVLSATKGMALLDEEGRTILRDRLIPVATLVTPNLEEAAWLWGREVGDVGAMKDAAKAIAEQGAASVLVTGGGGPKEAVDVLYTAEEFYTFREKRMGTGEVHGTGCALSAAITAHLANGIYLVDAVRAAKLYVTRAIEAMPDLGAGSGPLHHGVETGVDSPTLQESAPGG